MSSFMVLAKGELARLARYHIFTASGVVAAFWIAILHLAGIEDLTHLLILVVLVDTTVMAMIMVGVSTFFEHDEGSIKGLLVAPITALDYVVAKSVANVVSNLSTLLILYGYAYFFRTIDLFFWSLLPAVLLIALFHSILGFLVLYRSRDFTGLLMGVFSYTLVVMLPVAVGAMGLIENRVFEWATYLLPTRAALLLIGAASGNLPAWEIGYAIAYLMVGGVLLLGPVLRGFSEFSSRAGGV